MAKKSIARISPSPSRSSSPSPTAKPLPARPGTSGTEALLTTNRRTASAHFIAAQRAEQTYKAKKRTASAKVQRSDAARHFGDAGRSFGMGMKCLAEVVRAGPWVVRSWCEEWREGRDARERVRVLERKRRLEERLEGKGKGRMEEREDEEEEGVKGETEK
ncbi:hypothetical protein B0J11DRAFT_606547 [Dendryphion nanum]|uniref:Uncharacterized protein n=1 Tax=Dendryphion nanum TaxID=256645 RepID=A0A9P9DQU1_9PLEO|nr:hypothetical protein B0J11DRAFT_606547 [Dendryphion nanum]